MHSFYYFLCKNRNTTRRCRTKKCIARKLVKSGERTQRVSSPIWPGWVQYTASFCTWVSYSFYYMPVFMQFGSVLGACNKTENIELCYRPMKTLDLTSVCYKVTYLTWENVWHEFPFFLAYATRVLFPLCFEYQNWIVELFKSDTLTKVAENEKLLKMRDVLSTSPLSSIRTRQHVLHYQL